MDRLKSRRLAMDTLHNLGGATNGQ